MTAPSSANVELTILLPLEVIANQLMKVEADLRFLNAKTVAYATQGGGLGEQIATRLERINEALDKIRDLIADFEADIDLKSLRSTSASSSSSFRKPLPERDD
jgi:hypothetical protein